MLRLSQLGMSVVPPKITTFPELLCLIPNSGRPGFCLLAQVGCGLIEQPRRHRLCRWRLSVRLL